MPEMDGMEATRIIRNMNNDKATIPIIALTADIAAGNISEYMSCGMNAVCAKPIELDELLPVINTELKEEIHRLGNAEVEEVVQLTRVEIAPLKTTPSSGLLDDGFSQLLERVSNIAENSPDTADRPSPLASKVSKGAAEKLDKLKFEYEKTLLQNCNSLEFQINDLAERPADVELKEKMSLITHKLKGSGDTFGYNLVSTIATEADTIFNNTEPLAMDDIQNIKNHIDALSLIANMKLTGDGGEAGRVLLQGLR